MRRETSIALALVAAGLFVVVAAGRLLGGDRPQTPLEALKARYAVKHVPSVDHSKLAALQQPFASPSDVTAACLSCHTERGKEVMASSHWNWSREEYIPGRGIRTIGKKNILNNFCIGVTGNLGECDKCHAGYGFVDSRFDFKNPRNIDCLACHDGSNTYVRTDGGVPDPKVDLHKVAQSVGRPTRTDCGTCHFFGGGGNGVKHGDLDDSMFEPTRDLDVHMASDGANLQCVDCHAGTNHQIKGKVYSLSSMNRSRVTCEQCHTAMPHADDLLNEHAVKVACQTCHIPEFARVNETKMTWDWSTAGRLKDGKPFEIDDKAGNPTYLSIKGTSTWQKNVVPTYIWFNGTAGHYLVGDRVSADRPIELNTLDGGPTDPESKIVPVKVHRARQPYDTGNQILIQPKLYAEKKGEGAFWRDFDWPSSFETGMREIGQPYSGKYAFVDTVMTWPVNHMVAPKEKALGCTQCHTREGSRLAAVQGVYLPGRDRRPLVDLFGRLAVFGALAGAFIHGSARIVARRRRGGR